MAKGFMFWLEQAGIVEAVDDGPPSVAPPTTHAPSTSTTAPKATPPAPSAQPVADAAIAELYQGAQRSLASALKAAPTPAMDALGDMIEPLAQAIPDEGTRYVTAINIIKKTHPVEALLSDFDRCLGAIEDSKQQFEGALERQLRQRVGAREATIKNNDERMETLNTQIAQLTRQLQTLQAERDEAQGSIAKERHQLDLTKQQYELAYREVRHGLEAQRAKVVQHGGV